MTVLASFLHTGVNPTRRRAPTGMMYKIDKIVVNVAVSDTGTIKVVPYLVEDEFTGGDISDWLVVARQDILGDNIVFDNLDEMTKYISILGSAAAVSSYVTIFGEIVSASKVQLIVEWLRRGR